MLPGLPFSDAGVQDPILARRPVDQVADPGVPAGLDLAGVELLVLVVDPARPQRELFLHILVELVAVPVAPDQRPGFGVAWFICRGGGNGGE